MSTDFFNDQERIKPFSQKEFERLLNQEAKERGHKRQQQLMDAVTKVACNAILLVPIVLASLYLVVLVHKAWVGQWEPLEDTLKSMLVPVCTYLAGLLSKNVLKHQAE